MNSKVSITYLDQIRAAGKLVCVGRGAAIHFIVRTYHCLPHSKDKVGVVERFLRYSW